MIYRSWRGEFGAWDSPREKRNQPHNHHHSPKDNQPICGESVWIPWIGPLVGEKVSRKFRNSSKNVAITPGVTPSAKSIAPNTTAKIAPLAMNVCHDHNPAGPPATRPLFADTLYPYSTLQHCRSTHGISSTHGGHFSLYSAGPIVVYPASSILLATPLGSSRFSRVLRGGAPD